MNTTTRLSYRAHERTQNLRDSALRVHFCVVSTQLVLGAAKTLCKANLIARPALSGRQLPPYILSFPPVGAHRLEVPVLARVPLGACRLEAPILSWDLTREPEEKSSGGKNVQKCADLEEKSWTFG